MPIVSWLGLPGPRSARRQTGSARPWAECLASPPAARQKAGGEVEADRGQEAESPSTGLSDLLHLDSDPRASPTGQRVFLSGANSPEQQTLLGSPREADRPQNAWWTVTKLHLLAPKPPAPSQEETWSRAVRCPCGHTVGRSTARTATRGDRTRRRRRRGVPGWAFPSTACSLSPTPASARTGKGSQGTPGHPETGSRFPPGKSPMCCAQPASVFPGKGSGSQLRRQGQSGGIQPPPQAPTRPRGNAVGSCIWRPPLPGLACMAGSTPRRGLKGQIVVSQWGGREPAAWLKRPLFPHVPAGSRCTPQVPGRTGEGCRKDPSSTRLPSPAGELDPQPEGTGQAGLCAGAWRRGRRLHRAEQAGLLLGHHSERQDAQQSPSGGKPGWPVPCPQL